MLVSERKGQSQNLKQARAGANLNAHVGDTWLAETCTQADGTRWRDKSALSKEFLPLHRVSFRAYIEDSHA